MVGEVKWTNDFVDIDIVDDLIRKSKFIDFKGEYTFLFISKNGFTERAIKRMGEIKAIYLHLKDISRIYDDL